MDNLLQDVWANMTGYYNDLVAVLPRFGLAILAFFIFITIAGWLKGFSKRRLTARMDDPLLADFLSRITKIGFTIIGFLVALHIIGLSGAASSILAGAGISAFVIGFALKDIGENFLAGIMMAFKRPFRIGDTIETSGITGKVIGLNLRDTHVKTFDGKDVYIPNGSIVRNPLINYTIDGFLRYDFTVGVDYGSDIAAAERIILAELKAVDGVLHNEKKPSVVIGGMSSSTLDLTTYFWIDTFDSSVNSGRVKTRAIDRCLTALANAGIYMPGDVLELKNYQDGDLKTAMGEKAPKKEQEAPSKPTA